MTTKQVRKRLDLNRPVPRELLLESIDVASHAPMGSNTKSEIAGIIVEQLTEEIKAQIAPIYQAHGSSYLAARSEGAEGRQGGVIESASFLLMPNTSLTYPPG